MKNGHGLCECRRGNRCSSVCDSVRSGKYVFSQSFTIIVYPAQEEQAARKLEADVQPFVAAHTGTALVEIVNWRAARALSLFLAGAATVTLEVMVTVEVRWRVRGVAE